MAMNLRLRPDAEQALRAEAQRSDRSQQDVLRAAVDSYLRLGGPRLGGLDELITSGRVNPPRTPYRKVSPSAGSDVPSMTLLDRDDRI